MKAENLKRLTQKDWEEQGGLCSQVPQTGLPTGPVDFGTFLEAHGFSRHIEEVIFHQFNFCNFSLVRLEFHECNFAGCDFRDTSLSDLQLTKCDFTKTKWLDTTWLNISLNACNFSRTEIVHSAFRNVSIKNSMLSGSYWNHTQFVDLQIYNSILNESIFYSTSIHASSMSHTELKDAFWIQNAGEFLQTNCKVISTNRPVVGMAWDFLQRGNFSPYIDEALRDNGAVVLKIAMQPRTVAVLKLSEEVDFSLSTHIESDSLTIVEKIFYAISQKPEINQLSAKAKSLLDYCNALVLPGGEDIELELYNFGAESGGERDYRRSITEISLLAHAHKQKMPVMGICRGSQMINIYFGGTLRQLSEDEKGWQDLALSSSSKKDEIQNWISGDTLSAFSMHRQASDRIGNNLEVIMEREGIVKFLISHDSQFIGVQFHPEAYLVTHLIESPPGAIHNKGVYKFFFSEILQHQMQNV